jgi:hypothetical protein
MIIDKIDKRLKTFFSENLQNEIYFLSSDYDYRNEAGFVVIVPFNDDCVSCSNLQNNQ